MKQTAYGQPLLINSDSKVTQLVKDDFAEEQHIQSLIFNYPECLPISDIDEAYNPLIPICEELSTPAGYVDLFMVNPNGEIAILEAKLWRNPEARRKVVAQTLDYAKAMALWTYDDVEREVKKRTNTALYQLISKQCPDTVLPESDFIDAVNRNLRRGKFLLLIVGDGIREGASGIAEFLSSAGYLNFTFAMVELTVYKAGEQRLLIPKTLVKTVELSKMSVVLPEGMKLVQDADYDSSMETEVDSEYEEKHKRYHEFWKELLEELTFDDPGQPLPNPGNAQNLFVYPITRKKAWISAYFAPSSNRIGVYFRAANDQEGYEIIASLEDEKEDILKEFNNEVNMEWDRVGTIIKRSEYLDIQVLENRKIMKEFFKTWLNNFVNVMRPRLKRIADS
ncbi:MAG: DUF4268 domain-containing protein [Marinoscillum sp.]